MAGWNGAVITLESWSDFALALNIASTRIGVTGNLAVRNFDLITYETDEDGAMGDEVDRLDIVRRTGTDRDGRSAFWNAEGHDYDHDKNPVGKKPDDLIYAYVVELTGSGYVVHYDGDPEVMDLTTSLDESNGILVFDAGKLLRVSKNEHWFRGDPRDALLMIFLCAEAL